VPSFLLKDRSPLDNFLQKVVRDDEDTHSFRDYFLPLLKFSDIQSAIDNFILRMQESLVHPDLDYLLCVAKLWVTQDAAQHTMLLPVNVRTKISSFRAVEFDDRPGGCAKAFQVR